MKKILIVLNLLIITSAIIISCKKNTEPAACGGTGSLCISNKRDSLLIVNIVQIHTTVNISHDQMICENLNGGNTYTLKFSGPAYTSDLKDTTFLVQNCDKKLMTILPPTKK